MLQQIKVPEGDMLRSSQMVFSWTSHMEDATSDRVPADICLLYAHLSLLGHILKSSALRTVFSANPAHVFTVIDSITHILRTLAVPGLIPELESYRGWSSLQHRITFFMLPDHLQSISAPIYIHRIYLISLYALDNNLCNNCNNNCNNLWTMLFATF